MIYIYISKLIVKRELFWHSDQNFGQHYQFKCGALTCLLFEVRKTDFHKLKGAKMCATSSNTC